MSICQALLRQVAQIARQQQAKEVARVTIEVGPLSGVEPEQLRRIFTLMRSGACAAADLVIETAAVLVRCLACGTESTTSVNRLTCGACEGFRTRVIAGDELRLCRVELRV